MKSHISWVSASQRRLEKQVLSEFSLRDVRGHLDYLTTFFRRAGTDGETKAARYIQSRLEEYGVDTRVHAFDGYVSYPVSAEVEIVSPAHTILPALPRTFIPSTPPEGIAGDLVSVGTGTEDDYRRIDVRGRIALARMGGLEDRVEAARLAQERGALAQVFITMGKSRAILTGQSRYTWGSPTPETLDHLPKIPALSVCREDGELLSDLLKKGPVTLRVKADAWTGYRTVTLPEANLPGAAEPEAFVLLAGHYCSWFTGAVDNAVANSLMLEMVRVLSKHRRHLARGVRFAWWTGHEQGTYAGSTWYADHFWKDLRDHAVAYLVMDGMARIGSSAFEIKNTEEIRAFQETAVKDALGLDVKSRRVPKSGDQSFWGMGLPSFLGRTGFPSERDSANEVGARWYDHTAEDTMDKVDMNLLPVHFRAHTVSTLRLCNSVVLPFEFVTMAREIKRGLTELSDDTPSLPRLTAVLEGVEALERGAEALTQRIEKNLRIFLDIKRTPRVQRKVDAANRGLMGLSRILLPVLSTKAGKYGQDPMGTRYRPVPALQPLKTLRGMDPGTEESKALYTSLVRERNRLSDALHCANELIQKTLSLL
jgi:hypothetical protein